MTEKKDTFKWKFTYIKNQTESVYAVYDCKIPEKTIFYKELKEVFDMGFIESFNYKKS